MFKFIETTWYLQLTIFIAMPLNGLIIADNPILGIILILMQVPYILGRIKNDI